MLHSKQLRFAVALLGIAAVGTIASVARAGDGPFGHGVTADTPLVTALLKTEVQANHDRIKLQTKDRTFVRVQKLTFAAGSHSGWHHHPGVLVVAVQSGSVDLYDSSCAFKTYGPGQADGAVFVEGHDNAQEARSVNGAVVYVTYFLPETDPVVARVNDQRPFCDTQTP